MTSAAGHDELRRHWRIIVAGALIYGAATVIFSLQYSFLYRDGGGLSFEAAAPIACAGAVAGLWIAGQYAERGLEKQVVAAGLLGALVVVFLADPIARVGGDGAVIFALNATSAAAIIVPWARAVAASFDAARTQAFALSLAAGSALATSAPLLGLSDLASSEDAPILAAVSVIAVATAFAWLSPARPPPEPMRYSPVGPAPILGDSAGRMANVGLIVFFTAAVTLAGLLSFTFQGVGQVDSGFFESTRYFTPVLAVAFALLAPQLGDLATLRFALMGVVAALGAAVALAQGNPDIAAALAHLVGRTCYVVSIVFLPVLLSRYGPFAGFAPRLAFFMMITYLDMLATVVVGESFQDGVLVGGVVAVAVALVALTCVARLPPFRPPERAW